MSMHLSLWVNWSQYISSHILGMFCSDIHTCAFFNQLINFSCKHSLDKTCFSIYRTVRIFLHIYITISINVLENTMHACVHSYIHLPAVGLYINTCS